MKKMKISEKIHININGAKQGMFLKAEDDTKPVLLFLHGGPGMPEYFLEEKYPVGLEKQFVVCWWEQRGAGLSYINCKAGTITSEQLVNDTLEVTDYLRRRFCKDKIFLMGHSWGTFLGIRVAAEKPELYHAYIGVSQVSFQLESEKLAYAYMRKQYEAAGNTKMNRKLKRYADSETGQEFNSYLLSPLRDEAMHKLGIGTMRDMTSVVKGIFCAVMQCKAYTFGEKINIWRGKSFLNRSTNLRQELYTANLTLEIPRLELPVYFFCGLYDYTVSYKMARSYLKRLQAPVKGFYTFEQSAHSPMFEERERFCKLLREDVLNLKISLADRILD